jgi:hypothetical protein
VCVCVTSDLEKKLMVAVYRHTWTRATYLTSVYEYTREVSNNWLRIVSKLSQSEDVGYARHAHLDVV